MKSFALAAVLAFSAAGLAQAQTTDDAAQEPAAETGAAASSEASEAAPAPAVDPAQLQRDIIRRQHEGDVAMGVCGGRLTALMWFYQTSVQNGRTELQGALDSVASARETVKNEAERRAVEEGIDTTVRVMNDQTTELWNGLIEASEKDDAAFQQAYDTLFQGVEECLDLFFRRDRKAAAETGAEPASEGASGEEDATAGESGGAAVSSPVSDPLTITGLTQAGHGMLHHDGAVLTLPFSAPGDLVRLNEGEAGPELAIAEPCSPDRQKPPCPVFGRCGGCRVQHLSDDAVARWKRQLVVSALEGAGLDAETVEPTRTVAARSRRRAKFALQRTKKSFSFGFFEHASHRIVPASGCEILAPALRDAMPALAELGLLGAPRKRALAISATLSETGLDVSVEGGKEPDLALRGALAERAEAADFARVVWNDEPIALRRPPVQRFGAARIAPPPGAFLQASPDMETIALAIIREEIGAARNIADLFSGCGTFSLPLLDTATVTARDADAAMIEAMDAGWRQAEGLKRLDAAPRDLFRRPMRPEELKGFDAILFDPPRAGAAAQAAELARCGTPCIIGISCNPVTFARDARTLSAGGYGLTRVVPVDQFRWSAHTEVIGVFRRSL